MNDLYEELYLSEDSSLDAIWRILAKQRRDWTVRSDGMPDEAARMLALIDEADAAFADEGSRDAYDAELAASREPVVDPDRDAQRQADYERFCALASDYFDTEEFDLAEVAIGNALKNAPAAGADLELCKLAADTYFELGKFDPSLTYLNQAIVLAPDDPELYLQKFWVAYELGETTPDDRRGSDKALMNVLRIAISKAESVADKGTLGQSLDSSFENARNVIATKLRRQEQQRAEELRRERERQLKAAEVIMNAAGGPVWVVLDVDLEHGRALFITRDIIAQMPYHKKDLSITWDKCSLRKWLNTEFFGSLPPGVKSRVIEVSNHTSGRKSTKDRVFLLSLDEVEMYFKNDYERIAKFKGSAGWWWLRSPGDYEHTAASVDNDGDVYDFGRFFANISGGVRPALFFNLDA